MQVELLVSTSAELLSAQSLVLGTNWYLTCSTLTLTSLLAYLLKVK